MNFPARTKRRSQLGWVVSGMVFFLFSSALASSVSVTENSAPTASSLRGVYLTASSAGKMGQTYLNQIKNSGGTAVVIDIQHSGGLLAFQPKNETLAKLNAGTPTLNGLPELIRQFHKEGIYVIARQVTFNQPYMSQKHPEWRIKKRRGGSFDYRWIDPSLLAAQDYNLMVMEEAASLGFDEIQFDYIRFPAASHQYLDYDYDETQLTRADVINGFLKKAVKIAHNKGIRVGADVYGVIVWGEIDWKIVGQNPHDIAQIVDAIYPMTYPSHFGQGFNGYKTPHGQPYAIVHDSVKKFVDASGEKAEIRPWIQGFPLKIPRFGTWFMKDQIKASYAAGASDFMIWSPGNIYTLSWPVMRLKP